MEYRDVRQGMKVSLISSSLTFTPNIQEVMEAFKEHDDVQFYQKHGYLVVLQIESRDQIRLSAPGLTRNTWPVLAQDIIPYREQVKVEVD